MVYRDEVQLAIAFKKRSKQHIEEISLDLLKGLDLQAVYENLIKSLLPGSKESIAGLEQAIEKKGSRQVEAGNCRPGGEDTQGASV